MSQFDRTVSRVMTVDEATAKCAEMGLDEKLTAFVVKEFTYANDEHEEGPEDEAIVREDGRIGFGQSWEHYYEELAKACGHDEPYTDEVDENGFLKPHADVERVWNAFFDE